MNFTDKGLNYPWTITVNKTGFEASAGDIVQWTETAAEGVVFRLDPTHPDYDDGASSGGVPTGTRGKIVSLDEANRAQDGSRYGLLWSTEYEDTGATSTTSRRNSRIEIIYLYL